jgi:dipeptidyl aminopeptidase/acylaminoacyl peptidase
VGIILGTAAVAALAYVAAAFVVYDRVSRVSPDCGGRFVDNTPASWSADNVSSQWSAPSFDAEPLLVQDYRDVRFPSRDAGIDLHAWWLPAPNGPQAATVIVVHGRGSCVRDPTSLAPAGMLHRLGYGVLLLDLRDHGTSTIEDGRYAGGTEEFRDVLSAVDWLKAEGLADGPIGAFGSSMGAATVVIAAGQDPRIVAVWEDSGYADIQTRIEEELRQQGYPALLAPASTLMARIVSGDDLASFTVLGGIANMAGRHLFIAHGAADRSTFVTHAADLAAAAWTHDVLTDLWVVPEAGHVQAMFLEPIEYERRLGRFFGEAFEAARPRP